MDPPPSRLFLFFQARLFSLILTGLLSLGILVDGKMSMSLLFKRGTTQRRTCLAKQESRCSSVSYYTINRHDNTQLFRFASHPRLRLQFNRHEAAETKDKASVEPNRDFGGHVLLYGVAALFEPFREEQRHRKA